MPDPVEVFISYARQDAIWFEELKKHLAVLQRDGRIRSWDHAQICPGENWRQAIEKRLTTARLILILVSPDFFSSNTCHEVQRRAFGKRSQGQALVIPILLRSCTWEATPLGQLQPLPDNRRPVANWPSADDAWTNVVRRIWGELERLSAPPPAANAMGFAGGGAPPFSDASRRISAPPTSPSPYPQPHPTAPYSQPHPTMPPYSSPHPMAASTPASARALAPPPPPSRVEHGRRALRRIVGFLLMLALAGVVAFAFWQPPELFGNGKGPIDRREAPPTRPSPPAAPAPAAPSEEVCPSPCCGGPACRVDSQNAVYQHCSRGGGSCEACPSGRACVPVGCSSLLAPSRAFQLRLGTVFLTPAAIGDGVARDGEVCVRRSRVNEAPVCTPFSAAGTEANIPALSAAKNRLSIALGDLLDGNGIDIDVYVGGSLVAYARPASHKALLSSALCKGVNFNVSTANPPLGPAPLRAVVFFLDD